MSAAQDTHESSNTPRLLSIGELAERTGVAATALGHLRGLPLEDSHARVH